MLTPRVTVCLALLVAPGAALADPPACDPKDPENCVYTLKAGERSPVDGLLFTPRRSAVLQAGLESAQERMRLLLEQAAAVAAAKLAGEQQLRKVDDDAAKLRESLLRGAIDDVRPSPWEHPALWFALGVVSTVVVTAGTVAIYDAVSKARTIVIPAL